MSDGQTGAALSADFALVNVTRLLGSPYHNTHTQNAVMNYLQAQLTFSSQHASEPATLKAAGYDLCYRLLWCGIVEFNVPLDTFYGSYDTTNSVTALKDNGQVNQVKGQSYQARLTER